MARRQSCTNILNGSQGRDDHANLPMDAVLARVSPSGGSFVLGAFTEAVGFEMYGYERRAMKHNGTYYDEELMTYWIK